MEKPTNETTMTVEELTARKEEMRKFYDDSIPYLESQCKHEELLARISEARYKRMRFDIEGAMMMQGPEQELEKETEEEPVTKERKLKKE